MDAECASGMGVSHHVQSEEAVEAVLNDYLDFAEVADRGMEEEAGSGDRYLNHLYTNKKWGGRTS